MGNYLLRGILALILVTFFACGTGLVRPSMAAQDSPGVQDLAPNPAASKAVGDNTAVKAEKAPAGAGDSNVFTLGEIEVKDSRDVNKYVTSDKVVDREMREFSRDRLSDALDLLPGVTLNSTGIRNEKTIYVRGFSLTRVPVFLDGIPVYMAYDKSFDFNRFSTFDLSEIIVTKGFTSVLYGANTMGGAVNMVSRRPVKSFEGNAGAGYGTGNMYYGYANAGTNQKKWYIQGGVSYMNQTYYPLSDNFTSTNNEHGKNRTHSDSQDSRINLKIGLTPLEGHEYVFGWIKQEGAKGGPPDALPYDSKLASIYNTYSSLYNGNRWLWPRWNFDSYSFTSHTPLGDKSYAKTRLFYNVVENWLDFYATNNNAYAQTNSPQGQRSNYYDYSAGGVLEMGTKLIPYNDIRASFHYKRDSHSETQSVFNIAPKGKTAYGEFPWVPSDDATISAGLQDTIDFTKNLYAIAGVSYDKMDALRAKKWVNTLNTTGTTGYVGWLSFNTESVSKINPQLGLFYRVSDTGIIHATAESKTRFPTMKERYSWSFGRSIENPSLKPEQAMNYELGYEDVFAKRIRFKTAIFRNDISDAIQQVVVANPYLNQPGWTAATVFQNQNIGRVQQYGLELQGDVSITDNLDAGLNYTYLNRTNMRSSGAYIRLIEVPVHKVFTYMKYRAPFLKGLSALGSFEYGSSRTNTSDGLAESGCAAILNAKVMYEVIKDLIVEGGVNNLLDRNYQYSYGFPESGRTLFAGLRYRF
jgi:iron complex outermembrane recepter protein